MKILTMELENFRQFYGKQSLEFASEDENITIIFGENGKGKTGIFRALIFALYNATHIQQDNPAEKIHLVNFRLLDEQPGIACTAKVTVRFEHNGKHYEITRSVLSIKNGSRVEERSGGVKFYEIDENGNYSPNPIEDLTDVQNKMNQILDEEIKDFFLFDGEKIDTLAKTNKEVKKEVKTAIFKLLQIDHVDEASALLSQLKNSEQRSVIDDTDDTNAQGKQNEIDEVSEQIVQSQEQLDTLRNEEQASNGLIQKYELELSENKEIGEIQEKLKSHQSTHKALVEHLEMIKNQLSKTLFQNMPYTLLKDAFNNVGNYLGGIVSDNESNVSLEVIDESLEKKVCACCNNDLETHKENLAFVELLKQNYKDSQSNEISRGILRMIETKKGESDTVRDEAIALLKDYDSKEREIRDTEEIINQIQKDVGIKANEQLNLEETNKALQSQRDYMNKVRENIAKTEVRLDDLRKQKEVFQNDLDQIIKTNKNNMFEQKVIDIINSLNNDILDIASDFSVNMRHNLTKATTKIFKRLIDQKDANLIKEILINNKFELEIMNYNDIEITQDISQGQRHIVSLAFITSLALVAAGDEDKIAFPLFMDSPFNRLSGDNRDHLIKYIPDLTSQWILLLTDTELTVSEERVIKENGRLGKWYRLNQVDTYHSVIEEVPLHETLTTRGM